MQLCTPPPALKSGDRLHVISPSGALREKERLEAGLQVWRDRGYDLYLSKGYDDRHGYLAGTDAVRRSALTAALVDPDCRGILCVRGGWGGARLLEDWVWPQLSTPKWLVGFSDITSLLWRFGQAGVVAVHGPVLTTLGVEPNWSRDRLFDLVEGRSLSPLQGKGWGGGIATGLLLPANLTVATHLLGTALQPDLDNVILALEDVGESPYRLDRMLTHWRMTGAFAKVRGIALGRFSSCEPPEGYDSFSVEEVLRDRLGDLNIPIVSDLPFGHEGENAALAVGTEVSLDSDRGILQSVMR
jgi:muramoyltetrapeptide carboxypeptidase